jgi:hypothetical protein
MLIVRSVRCRTMFRNPWRIAKLRMRPGPLCALGGVPHVGLLSLEELQSGCSMQIIESELRPTLWRPVSSFRRFSTTLLVAVQHVCCDMSVATLLSLGSCIEHHLQYIYDFVVRSKLQHNLQCPIKVSFVASTGIER